MGLQVFKQQCAAHQHLQVTVISHDGSGHLRKGPLLTCESALPCRGPMTNGRMPWQTQNTLQLSHWQRQRPAYHCAPRNWQLLDSRQRLDQVVAKPISTAYLFGLAKHINAQTSNPALTCVGQGLLQGGTL